MSRISPAFHLTILLLPVAAVLSVASSAFADPELRRLPISFDRLAPHPAVSHRLTPRKAHHRAPKPVLIEDDSEALVRAANALAVNGYTEIKALSVEGDHITAEVVKDDQIQHLVVTKEGAVAAGDAAATALTPAATANDASAPASASPASANAAPAGTSTTATEPAPTPVSTVSEPQSQIRARADAGSTSEAASPGALSASNNTP